MTLPDGQGASLPAPQGAPSVIAQRGSCGAGRQRPWPSALSSTVDDMNPTVRVLTVRQPHAWAICAGLKTVENRTRRAGEPGTILAILAGHRFDPPLRVKVTEPDTYVHGAVIGAAILDSEHVYVPRLFTRGGQLPCAGCDDPWADPTGGTIHHMLRSAVMLDEPIPMRGSLVLQEPPEPVRRAVLDALGEPCSPVTPSQ